MPWKLPWWLVVRARIGGPQRRPRSGPGTSSSRCRSPRTRGRRCCRPGPGSCSAANRTTRSCQYRPSAVGLNVSMASGRTAGSASSSRRRSRNAWAHSGYGTRGWAGIAMPPCSWTAAIGPAEAAQGRHRALEEQAQQVAAAGADLLAHDHPGPEPAVERDPAGRQGGVDPLVVGDRDDVEHGLALDAVEDLGHRRRPVGGERVDVEVGPAEPVGGVREAVARPSSRRRPGRGPARSGGRRPTTARGRRRAASRASPRRPPSGR